MEAVKNFLQPVHRHIRNGSSQHTDPHPVSFSTQDSQTVTHSYWLLLGMAECVDEFLSFGFLQKELNYIGVVNGKRTYQTAKEIQTDFPFFALVLKVSLVVFLIRRKLGEKPTIRDKKDVYFGTAFNGALCLTVKVWLRYNECIQNTVYNFEARLYEDIPPETPITVHTTLQNVQIFFTPTHTQIDYINIVNRTLSLELLRADLRMQPRLNQAAYLGLDLTKCIIIGLAIKKYALLTAVSLGILLDIKRWDQLSWGDAVDRARLRTNRRRIEEQDQQTRKREEVLRNSYNREVPSAPVPEKGPKANFRAWMQQWQCFAFFPLYAMGYDFQETVSDIERQQIQGEPIKFQKGEEGFELSSNFVKRVPLFLALLRFHGNGEALLISKDSPLSPTILKTIEQNIDNPLDRWVTDPINTALDYLCLDLSYPQFDHFYLNQGLLEKDIETLQKGPEMARFCQSPPSIKVPSPNYSHFEGEVVQEIGTVQIDQTDQILPFIDKILSQITREGIKTYQINALIQNLISNSLKNQDGIIDYLLSLVQQRPELSKKITILELPSQVNLSKLDTLLIKLPHLLWLSLTSNATLNVNSLPKMEKLRVIKIDEMLYDPQKKEALFSKLPLVEVAEIGWVRKSFQEWSQNR